MDPVDNDSRNCFFPKTIVLLGCFAFENFLSFLAEVFLSNMVCAKYSSSKKT